MEPLIIKEYLTAVKLDEEKKLLFAYEIKFGKPRLKPPATWVENYGHNYHCITRDSFFEFVM